MPQTLAQSARVTDAHELPPTVVPRQAVKSQGSGHFVQCERLRRTLRRDASAVVPLFLERQRSGPVSGRIGFSGAPDSSRAPAWRSTISEAPAHRRDRQGEVSAGAPPSRLLIQQAFIRVGRSHESEASWLVSQPYLRNSSFATVSRCTSSGPSARRSVLWLAQAPARKVSWHTPRAPWA